MPLRAGIVVTGTEVLTGVIADRNGPWLSERLRELGVDTAHIVIVGDRREDMRAALEFLRAQGMGLILTSGGLGPTADDLTAEVVGEFQGREMVLDEPLEQRIAEILKPLAKRFPHLNMDAIRAGNRKQAIVPQGAMILDPVGTAPGLVVAPAGGSRRIGPAHTAESQPAHAAESPTVVVLPGPPRELQPMWQAALQTEVMRTALKDAGEYRVRTLRLFGIPESEIAETLRVAEHDDGVQLNCLEITTCLRRGEIEVVTRYEPDAEELYTAFAAVVRRRHADTLFSEDGSTIDEQVATLLRGEQPLGVRDSAAQSPSQPLSQSPALPPRTIATAESCTGGMLAARLTDPPGASAYVRGGLVVYANEAKLSQAGVDLGLIEQYGAVSSEVAEALADGARARLDADIGVGITGIAGPGGGTEEKPVGLVCFSVAGPGDAHLTRSAHLPGGRADVRDRATTVAMHLIRRALADR
jgi:nicotinamide-nucleotide amidase